MAVALIASLASEVLTGFVRFAFSFIQTKTVGNPTDQHFRDWISRELDDIKSKLVGIARKELGASISFLQKGINRLNTAFVSEPSLQSAVKTSSETKPAWQSATVEEAVALANAISKIKIESSERFNLAKESFKEAGREATLAFHNTALSTEERFLASKVRFTSAILENLEDPEIARSDCLQFLKELHDMPAIKEIFSVHMQGGLKSWFWKDSRREMVETVTMINLILADFISKFTKQRMAVFDWPTIVCGKQVVHPIHFKDDSLPNLREINTTPAWDIVELEDDLFLNDASTRKNSALLALNKKGDLVCFTEAKHGPQKLVKTTHKLQPYGHPESGEKVTGITVDKDDTVYVLTHNEDASSSLSVYNAGESNCKHQSTLKFLTTRYIAGISITNNKNIVIAKKFSHPAYVCNRNGELINSFKPNQDPSPIYFGVHSVSVSSTEIVLVTYDDNTFFKESYRLSTYTQGGKFQRTVIFRTSSDWSDKYKDIFYNHVTNTIIGYGRNCDDKSFIEFVSSETGELQRSYLLYPTNFPEKVSNFRLVCHANGTMALVGERHVIYLQNSSPST